MIVLWLAACGFSAIDTKNDSDSAAAIRDSQPTGATTPTEMAVCVNEFMPSNAAAFASPDGSYDDWIEIHNPGDAPVYLQGWSLTDDPDDPYKHVLPEGVAVEGEGYLLLYADGETSEGDDHLGFSLPSEGGSLSLYAPDGRGNRIDYGESPSDFSVARATDCCKGEGCLGYVWQGTPGVANAPKVTEPIEVFPAGQTWRYWDQGSDPPSGWNTSAVDVGTWPAGPAPLGFGDAHIVTTVGYGADANNKYITTWFRFDVEIADTEDVEGLLLKLLRDDGAVVYVNGFEVARTNMPEGAITSATLALASTGDADETAYFEIEGVSTGLIPGYNVIGVEIHQASATSSDMGFDLALTVLREVE